MNIVRVEPVSTVDFPGEVSSVFFAKGCNMQCPWCFNKNLISFDLTDWKVYSLEEALKLVPKQIDCIVLSGGEAFAQEGIIETIHALKSKGYKVAVHTNGSFPKLLEKVIYSLDYVAIDIKGTLNKYEDQDIAKKVFQSIILVTDKGFPHEFRTTAEPNIERKELLAIAGLLEKLNAHAYYLQKYIGAGEGLSIDELKKVASKFNIKTGVRG